MGKKALLDYSGTGRSGNAGAPRGGCEAEAGLAYSGLHLLLRAVLSRAVDLPAPQANALRGALGMSAPGVHDGFLVGLALLGLLSELAGDSPVAATRPQLVLLLSAAAPTSG